jgi:multiple sugar transport system permease protein
VVPGLFNAFATFLFRQHYLDFPVEIEEAGRLDGLGYFGIYRGLVLPNSIGIIMALGVLSFINSWNAFLWPVVMGRYPSTATVQVVLSTYLTAQTINLPMLFMGAAVAAAPLIVVFLVMQRYIVQGVRLSGIKG